MKRAYRYRFYPTDMQKALLAHFFGCCRFVYNHFLNLKQKAWQEEQKTLSYSDCSRGLTALKQGYVWLTQVSSVCLQQSLRHLQAAFEAFFKKRARFPTFKRKDQTQSCAFMKNAFTYRDGMLTLAKMGVLNVRWSRSFTSTPSSLTVSRDRSGRYFVSLLVEEEIYPLPTAQKKVGLDLGISQLITDHEGKHVSFPGFLDKALRRLRRKQKSLSAKKKGSKNREKAKQHVAKLHAKVHDCRLDFLHKLSIQLINENQVIVAESLGIKKMLKHKGLARKISDAGWGLFLRLLEYKSRWYGREFVQIDPYFPSSKVCSNCGTQKKELLLSERQWCCIACHIDHERDTNAAKNILKEGLRLLSLPRSTRDFIVV